MGVVTALSCPRGQQRTYTASATSPTPIAGQNFAFSVRQPTTRQLLLQSTSANSGITITDAVNGVLSIVLTAAQTNWPAGTYAWDLWRTDSGFQDQLGSGVFTITDSYDLA